MDKQLVVGSVVPVKAALDLAKPGWWLDQIDGPAALHS